MVEQNDFSTGIIVRLGKAYIHTNAYVKDFATVVVDPIYIVDLDANEIGQALKKVYDAKNPEYEPISTVEFKSWPDVILKATKVRSWKKLREHTVSYSLIWKFNKNQIVVMASDPLSKGFVYAKSRIKIFPIDTNMKTLAQVVLDDLAERPEMVDPPL
jgi:hypothetical protein